MHLYLFDYIFSEGVTSLRFCAPLNATIPIDLIPSGITISSIEDPAKNPVGMFVKYANGLHQQSYKNVVTSPI